MAYLVSLYTKDPANKDTIASFNLAMFAPEKLEQAQALADCYGHAYETGYQWAGVRVSGELACFYIVKVGAS